MPENRIELATAYVPIVPTMRGIGANIEREFLGAFTPIAERTGAMVGSTIADQTGRSLTSRTGAIVSAFTGLGADLTRTATRDLNLAGPIEAEARSITGVLRNLGTGFISGFRDADAAASTFTGTLGTLGGRARTALNPIERPITNLISGFRDADAAASTFTGGLGTIGGRARVALEPIERSINNLINGFHNSEAAASTFTGIMGTAGGRARAAIDNVGAGTNFLADKLTGLKGKVTGVFDTGLTPIRNFKAGLEDADAAISPLTGRMGTLGGKASELGADFTRFRAKLRDAFDGAQHDAESSFSAIERNAAHAGAESGRSFSLGLKEAVAGIGLYMGAGELFSGVKESITKAGDLEQSVGAVDSVFKDSANQIHSWAKTASTSVGISENAYNEFSTVLGAKLKNAGTPIDQLGEKTNSLITLGADLASMYGGTTADAVDALSSALNGEMDPIEKYGITLNDAALTAEGLALGIQKTGGAFDDQQKKIIIQSLLMKQSADAQGNFNREQDTYAHKLQVASAKWEDLSTKIGGLFLPAMVGAMDLLDKYVTPVLEEVVGGLTAFGAAWTANDGDITSSGFAGYMEQLAFNLHSVYDAVVKTAPIWGPFAAGIGIVAAAFLAYQGAALLASIASDGIAIGLGLVTASEIGATGATAALGAAIQFLLSPVTLIVLAIGVFVGALILAYNNIGWFKDGVDTAFSWIQQVIGGFVNWWTSTAWPAIAAGLQAVGNWFTMLWTTYVVPAWNGIVSAIQWAWSSIIQPIFLAVVDVLRNFVAPIFMWLWNVIIVPVFQGIVAVISWAWNNILIPLFGMAVSVVRDILAPVFLWLWTNIITPAWNGISAVISFAWNSIIRPLMDAIVWTLNNVVGPVFMWLWHNIIEPVWNGIRIAIEIGWAAIRIIFDLVKAFLTNVLGPAFDWFWHSVIVPVWDGISSAIGSTWDFVRDRVFEPIKGALSTLKDAFVSTKDGIGRAWNSLKEAVGTPVRAVIDTVINKTMIAGYNRLNDFWKGEDLQPIDIGFARGGIIPGYQAMKKDEILTPMRRGEGVLVPEATRALGAEFIHGINAAANTGGISGAKKWAYGNGIAAGSSAGSRSWAGSETYTSGAPLSGTSGIWGALQNAMARAGKLFVPAAGVLGVSGQAIAAPWIGRSALEIIVGDGTPSVHIGTGTAGPWGFTNGDQITINPSAPSNMRTAILRHELGHALSLHHTENTGSIMHPEIAGVHVPSSLDYSALVSAWGAPGAGVKTYNVGDDGGSGIDIVGMITEKLGAPAKAAIESAMARFQGNKFVEMPVGIAKNSLGSIAESATHLLTDMGGLVIGAVTNGTQWLKENLGFATGGIIGEKPGIPLYDKGGLIHRGIQLINHQRSTPDRVLTDWQWNDISRLAQSNITNNRGGLTIEGDLVASDPDELIQKIQRAQSDREALSLG